MSGIEYLAKKLNIHGAAGFAGRGTDSDELTMMDVHAALGMGRLSDQAIETGLAVYTLDPLHRKKAFVYGVHAARKLFRERNWSAHRAVEAAVRAELRGKAPLTGIDHSLREEFAIGAAASALPHLMVNKVLAELVGDEKCEGCGGTGYIRAQLHVQCHGTGRVPAQETGASRARYCRIGSTAWKQLWCKRYNEVAQIQRGWLSDFESHLEARC